MQSSAPHRLYAWTLSISPFTYDVLFLGHFVGPPYLNPALGRTTFFGVTPQAPWQHAAPWQESHHVWRLVQPRYEPDRGARGEPNRSTLVSLPTRQYPGGGILAEGGRGAIGRRAIGTGVRELPSFGTHCTEAGPTAACLELCGHFRVVSASYGSASRALGIWLIKTHRSRVSTESPTRNTSCLTTEYYIAVHIKDPPTPNLSSWIRLHSWASIDSTLGIGLLGSGSLLLG
jgi:hypothetical protein